MRYHLLTADELPEKIAFLPGAVMERIRRHCGWLVIGQNTEEEIITLAAFTYDEADSDAVELAYIYTRPEFRGSGWAMGLLNYAENRFFKEGIRRFICCPAGTMDELMDWTGFLDMAEFEPLELDMHVYVYNRENILDNKNMKPYLDADENMFTHLKKDEINFYLNEGKQKLPGNIRDGMLRLSDPKRSLFAVEKDTIVAGIIVRQELENETDIINIYIYPKWQKKHYILSMLAAVIKNLPDTVKKINIAVDSERVRSLYNYSFGEPETDYWIQRYEKTLTGDKPTEE